MEICFALDIRGCEESTLVGIVTNHDFEGLVKLSLREKLSRLLGHVVSINYGTVAKCSISRLVGNLLVIGTSQSLGWQSPELSEIRSTRQVQICVVGILFLDIVLNLLPSWALGNSLLEWNLALGTSICGNVVPKMNVSNQVNPKCLEIIAYMMLPPPADSPTTVTRFGSPPNK